MGPVIRRRVLVAAFVVFLGGSLFSEHAGDSVLLLDDFSRADGRSYLSTEWEGFTDRVMGGRSEMSAAVVETEIGPALRMRGDVSLENRGGFIQVRLPLSTDGVMDASEYRGVAVTARASGDHYYLHLRTTRTRFPWSHYAQKIPLGENWERVELPFEEFEPRYMIGRSSPNVSRLRSLAVVAGTAEFTADIWIRSIELYK